MLFQMRWFINVIQTLCINVRTCCIGRATPLETPERLGDPGPMRIGKQAIITCEPVSRRHAVTSVHLRASRFRTSTTRIHPRSPPIYGLIPKAPYSGFFGLDSQHEACSGTRLFLPGWQSLDERLRLHGEWGHVLSLPVGMFE